LYHPVFLSKKTPFFSEKMHFMKINKDAYFPTLNSSSSMVCNIKSFKDFTIPAKLLSEISLGIILVHLKPNFVLQIKNTRTDFKVVNQFWLPSINLLTLSVYANTTVSLKVNDLLCQIQPMSVEHLLPGKPFDYFGKVKTMLN
jgi:hypothetical protein